MPLHISVRLADEIALSDCALLHSPVLIHVLPQTHGQGEGLQATKVKAFEDARHVVQFFTIETSEAAFVLLSVVTLHGSGRFGCVPATSGAAFERSHARVQNLVIPQLAQGGEGFAAFSALKHFWGIKLGHDFSKVLLGPVSSEISVSTWNQLRAK
jgi:hypothetical protein